MKYRLNSRILYIFLKYKTYTTSNSDSNKCVFMCLKGFAVPIFPNNIFVLQFLKSLLPQLLSRLINLVYLAKFSNFWFCFKISGCSSKICPRHLLFSSEFTKKAVTKYGRYLHKYRYFFFLDQSSRQFISIDWSTSIF